MIRLISHFYLMKCDYKNDHNLLQLIALSYVDEAMFEPNGKAKEHFDRKKCTIKFFVWR